MTSKYIHREKVIEYMQYYGMKYAKEKMQPLDKCNTIRNQDCRFVQPYMLKKSLEQSRLEFLWQTNMLDTRTTMKIKHPKGKYSCPHCLGGNEQGVLETPVHLLSDCTAYSDLRAGLNPEVTLEDRSSFLRLAIARRIKLEENLRKS